MADLWRDFWIRKTRTGQQVAQLHDRYMMMMRRRRRRYPACKAHSPYYTGCPRRNVPDFGMVFLMLRYADITQNTYVQSWTVTEIMTREKCGLLAGPRTVPVSWQSYRCPSLSVASYYGNSADARSKLLMYFLLGDKVVHVGAWHSCHV